MAVSTGDTLYAEASASVEPAPAKINLALHVTGRRSDGLHALDSLVVFAGEGDVIRAVPEPGGVITTGVEGPFAEALTEALKEGDNLVLKAALAMASKRPLRRGGTRIIINKRLPVAAGIGGDERGLAGIAARIGADVPMCLLSRPLRAQGAGERLTPVAGMPALPLVLVNPGVRVSTAKVFERLEHADDPPLPEIPRSFRSVFEFVIWLRQTRNGLDEPARAEGKVITRVVSALLADPDCLFARMSGSGPTCFGIFASPAAAQRAAIRLRVGRPEWWIVACVTGGS